MYKKYKTQIKNKISFKVFLRKKSRALEVLGFFPSLLQIHGGVVFGELIKSSCHLEVALLAPLLEDDYV